MSHYDSEYFKWQKSGGEIGGILNKFKFESDVNTEDVLLDFGCGGGYLLSNFDNKNKYGFDINPSALKNCDNLGIQTFSDFKSMKDNFFDTVISNHALEHVPLPLETLQNLFKKLKPGGKLILVVPCEQPSEQGFYYKEKDINQHLHTWCPMTLGNLVTLAGFKVLSCTPFQHQWCPDFQDTYMEPDFHNRCIDYAKKNGNIQIKVVAVRERHAIIQHGTDGFGHQLHGLLSVMMNHGVGNYYFDSHMFAKKSFSFEHGVDNESAKQFLINGVRNVFPGQIPCEYKHINCVPGRQLRNLSVTDTDTLYLIDNAYNESYKDCLKEITKHFMLPSRHDFKTIVLHARLGDALKYEDRRQKSLKYCEDVEEVLSKVVSGRPEYKIIVHTDSDDFTLKKHECMYYRKDTPILDVLADFINADVFVCGQSSLSYVSTLYDTHELVLIPDDVTQLVGKDCIRFSEFLANPLEKA